MKKTESRRSIAVLIIGLVIFAAATVTFSLGLVFDSTVLIIVGILVGLLGGGLYFFSGDTGVLLRKATSFRMSKRYRLWIIIIGGLPWVIVAFIFLPLDAALIVSISVLVGSVIGWLFFVKYSSEQG